MRKGNKSQRKRRRKGVWGVLGRNRKSLYGHVLLNDVSLNDRPHTTVVLYDYIT